MVHPILVLLLSLCLAMPVASQSRSEGAPAAIVMEFDGQAEFSRAGSKDWLPAELSSKLFRGDRIRVLSGTATLLSQDGRTAKIRPGALATIENRDASRQSAFKKLWEAVSERANLASGHRHELSAPGAVRTLAGKIDLISPRNTALLRAPREVRWRPLEGARAYRVSIRDGNGKKVLDQQVTEPRLSLSASRHRFEKGAYYFIDIQDTGTGGARSPRSFFQILTEDEGQSARADLSSVEGSLPRGTDGILQALTQGAIYEHWELLEDAMTIYRGVGIVGDRSSALEQARDLLYVKNGRRWAIARH